MNMDWIRDPEARAKVGEDILLCGNAFVVENDDGTEQRRIDPSRVRVLVEKKVSPESSSELPEIIGYEVKIIEEDAVMRNTVRYAPEHVWHGRLEHVGAVEYAPLRRFTREEIKAAWKDPTDALLGRPTMKLTKGTTLKARGGWDAEVVWVSPPTYAPGFYAVHKPESDNRSHPVWHWDNGTAHSVLVSLEPPTYDGHPADLEMGEYTL